jgi:hypothetical protein
MPHLSSLSYFTFIKFYCFLFQHLATKSLISLPTSSLNFLFLVYFRMPGYRDFTVASCAERRKDNHDLILHSSLYCMWYRTYTSELYRQLSSVDVSGLIRYPEWVSYFTTDSQSASLSWNKAPIWGFRPDFLLMSDNCGFIDVGRPLWREVGSVIYYVQCTIYLHFTCYLALFIH